MNEESQVSGCYKITFIYTRKQCRLSPESDTLVPRQQPKTTLLLQGHRDTGTLGHWERGCGSDDDVELHVLGCRLTYRDKL